ncbi:phosphatase inhibitor-domain-containing protein [Pholiota molesta]|nr:phosphatase inhibitor-domain-containing protein [Pholiota molesta]
MDTSLRPRASTSAPPDGSRTMTITSTSAPPRADTGDAVGALRLRPPQRGGNRVAWDEDVVDNEGAGRKKSKICCIYHKPKRYDESSDESSDSEGEDHPHPHPHPHNHPHPHHQHQHPHQHPHAHPTGAQSEPVLGQEPHPPGEVHGVEQEEEANAYERGPKGKRKAVCESSFCVDVVGR